MRIKYLTTAVIAFSTMFALTSVREISAENENVPCPGFWESFEADKADCIVRCVSRYWDDPLESHSHDTEIRCIVTRKRAVKMPTWDGSCPATIVHPSIWYFDPNADVQSVNLNGWHMTINHICTDVRRSSEPHERHTMVDFLREPPPFEPAQLDYGTPMMYR